MSDKMTQREWDRIVGIGKVPSHVQDPAQEPDSAIKEDILKAVKFTNHKSTYERHPETKKNAKGKS